VSGLTLTCGCYEDVYAEFEWDNFLDNSTDRLRSQPEHDVDTEGARILEENFAQA
jgi:hypothetical protein